MATQTAPRRTRTNARPGGLDIPEQKDPSRVTEPCGQTIRIRDGIVYFVVHCGETGGHKVKHRAILSGEKVETTGRVVAEITWSDA